MTNAEARFNNSLRPRKPEGSLGRTAQDVHLDSHTAPELWLQPRLVLMWYIYANSSMSVLGVYELTYSCASILFLLCTLSVYVCVIHHVCLCQSVILKPLLTICVPVLRQCNRAWTAATVQREFITTANQWRSVTTYFLGHIRNQAQCTVGLKWDQINAC